MQDPTPFQQADDIVSQIMTSIGTYISLLTGEQEPSLTEVKELMGSIRSPMTELNTLIETYRIDETLGPEIKELHSSHNQVQILLDETEETLPQDAASRIVKLYQTASDIDTQIFDLLNPSD